MPYVAICTQSTSDNQDHKDTPMCRAIIRDIGRKTPPQPASRSDTDRSERASRHTGHCTAKLSDLRAAVDIRPGPD